MTLAAVCGLLLEAAMLRGGGSVLLWTGVDTATTSWWCYQALPATASMLPYLRHTLGLLSITPHQEGTHTFTHTSLGILTLQILK